MKRIIALLVALLLVVCNLVSCKPNLYNAVIVNHGYTLREEWRENNIATGSFTQSPKTYIIRSESELSEIFAEFPRVDFEKEMVIVYRSMSIYENRYVIKDILLDGNKLSIELDKPKRIFGSPSTTAPRTRLIVIRMNKLDISKAVFSFD